MLCSESIEVRDFERERESRRPPVPSSGVTLRLERPWLLRRDAFPLEFNVLAIFSVHALKMNAQFTLYTINCTIKLISRNGSSGS